MATVKTKDYSITADDITTLATKDVVLQSGALKGYNTLSFTTKTIANIASAVINTTTGDLTIGVGETKDIIIKGYYNTKTKKVTSPIKYFADGASTVSIMDEWGKLTLDTAAPIGVPAKGTSVQGTLFSDVINVNTYDVPTEGKLKGKGLTINANSGNDTITGTTGYDVINAGSGDDTINVTAGNDLITGGKGTNTIVLANNTDNPTIVLTKGENLIIDAHSVSTTKNTYSYNINKNNLEIINAGKVIATIKNFAASDIVGSEGSVILQVAAVLGAPDTYVDLRSDAVFKYADFDLKHAAYTDKWYSSDINASSLDSYVPKNNKGATINAGAGNDEITGSTYNDTIKGTTGNKTYNATDGNDTIQLGKGINTYNAAAGSGTDTITLTKGELLTIDLNSLGVANAAVKVSYNGNNLQIKSTDNSFKDIVIKNIKSNANGDVLLSTTDNTYNVRSYGFANAFNISSEVAKGVTSYKGNAGADVVSAAADWAPKNAKSKTGITFNTGAGADKITGSDYNDTILAGDGDDEITATEGDDKITGGKGNNTVIYGDIEWGTDTYTLTKGENLNLTFNTLNKADLDIQLKGNDIVITSVAGTGNTTDSQIVLKNYGKTNVLGEGNAVTLTATDGVIDLSTYSFDYSDFSKIKAYTGNWHSQEIDATSAAKGVTINAVDGENVIYGSDYNDTIKGGKGDDYIIAGTGDDNLYGVGGDNEFVFNTGDGNDKVYSQAKGSNQGSDTLTINDTVTTNDYERDGNNLVIHYGDNDSVTVVGYFAGNSSVKTVNGDNIADLTFNATKLDASGNIVKNTANSVTVNKKTGAVTITGSVLNENLTGTDNDDTIKATAGDNTIIGGKGDDKLYAGTGVDTFKFDSGDGKDTIYNATSKDIIKLDEVTLAANLTFSKAGNNLEITSSDLAAADKITVANFFTSTDRVDTVKINNGANEVSIASQIDAGNLHITGKGAIKGTEGGDIIVGTDNYNDTITGGIGTDKIVAYDGMGKDTVIYTKGEVLTIEWTDAATTSADGIKSNYTFTKSGNDVIITKNDNADDRILIKGIANQTGTNITFSTTGYAAGVNLNTDIEYALGDSNAEKALNITGSNLSEKIEGGDGNDTLKAVGGNDTLIGNKGKDNLYGGADTTKFEFASGDGDDTVYLGTGANTLNFATGADLSYSVKGKDLIITNTVGTVVDNVTVKNYFDGKGHNVAITVNDVAVPTPLTITATDGADVITSNGGAVNFILGAGADVVTGGSANGSVTTFTIKPGDGNKTIVPGVPQTGETATNVIDFVTKPAAGDDPAVVPNASNFTYAVKGNDLIITYTQADTENKIKAETVTVKDYLKGFTGDGVTTVNGTVTINVNGTPVDTLITLAQGASVTSSGTITGTVLNETLKGGDGNDTIKAVGGTDTLDAGAGKNTLYGGVGANTYVFKAAEQSNDTLYLGEGTGVTNLITIDAAPSAYKASGNDLVITYGPSETASTLTIKNYLKADNTVPATISVSGGAAADLLTYVNTTGILLGDTDYESSANYGTGSKVQNVTGSLIKETIYGGTGKDTLKAAGIGDTLIGGKGNDSLYSAADNEGHTNGTVFQFTQGDGEDTIYNAKNGDQIKITTASSEYSAINYNRNGNDLVLELKYSYTPEGATDLVAAVDKITVKNYFTAESKIDSVQFAAETETKLSEMSFAVTGKGTINGTDVNDTINGSDSVDTINTGKGSDTINPGKSNDIININGTGTKIINLVDGEGSDTVNITDSTALVKLVYASAASVTYSASADGKDLIINHNNTANEVTTIKGYFALEHPEKITIGAAANTQSAIPAFNKTNLTINLDKAGTITGTQNGETITGSDGVDKISTGAGDDVVVASKGNDTITIDGAGDKEIQLTQGKGTDTVIFSKTTGSVNFTHDADKVYYTKSGNDLIITRVYTASNTEETTKVQGYFVAVGTKTVKVAGTALNFVVGPDKLTGTEGSIYSDILKGTSGKDTINTYDGTDTVSNLGAGADTVVINGTGVKTINIAKADGDNTIKLDYTKDQVADLLDNAITEAIVFTNDPAPTLSYEKSGNDLIITAKYAPVVSPAEPEVIQKTTLTNYFADGVYANTAKIAATIQVHGGSATAVATLINTAGLAISGTTGTDYKDVITATTGNDANITTGLGADTVYTKGGTDKVTINGADTLDNTIVIDRADVNSNVTVAFDQAAVAALEGSDKLSAIIKLTDTTADNTKVDDVTPATYTYTKKGNDLLIKVNYAKEVKTTGTGDDQVITQVRPAVTQTVTIQGYYTYVDNGTQKAVAKIQIGEGTAAVLTTEVGSDAQHALNIVDKETTGANNGKFVGTAVTDYITGTTGADEVAATGAGDDTFDLGAGNDKITIDATGNKTVIFASGDDTISGIGNSETTTIQFAKSEKEGATFADNADKFTYTKKGNDLVIDVDDSSSATVKDFFATDAGENNADKVKDHAKMVFGKEAASTNEAVLVKEALDGRLTVAGTPGAEETDPTAFTTDTTYGSIVNATAGNNTVTLVDADKKDTVNVDIDNNTVITQNNSTAGNDTIEITGTDVSTLSLVFDVTKDEALGTNKDLYILKGASLATFGKTGVKLSDNNYGSKEVLKLDGNTFTLTDDVKNAIRTEVGKVVAAINTANAAAIEAGTRTTYETAFEVLEDVNATDAEKKSILDIYNLYKVDTDADDTYTLTGKTTLFLSGNKGNETINITGGTTTETQNVLDFGNSAKFNAASDVNATIELVGTGFKDLKITYNNKTYLISDYTSAAAQNTLIKGGSVIENPESEGSYLTSATISQLMNSTKRDLIYEAKDGLSIEKTDTAAATTKASYLHFAESSKLTYETSGSTALKITNIVEDEKGNVIKTETVTINGFFEVKEGAKQATMVDAFEKFKVKIGTGSAKDIETLLTAADLKSTFVSEFNDVITASANLTELSGDNTITTAGSKNGITITSSGASSDDKYIVTSMTNKTIINDADGTDSLQANGVSDLYYVFDVAATGKTFDASNTYALDSKLYVMSSSDIAKAAAGTATGVQIDKYQAGWTAKSGAVDAVLTTPNTNAIEKYYVADSKGENVKAVAYKAAYNQLSTLETRVRAALDGINTAITTANAVEGATQRATFNTSFEVLKNGTAEEKALINNAYLSVRAGSDADNTFTTTIAKSQLFVGDGSDKLTFTAGSIGDLETSAENAATNVATKGARVVSSTTGTSTDILTIKNADAITNNISDIWSSSGVADTDLIFTVKSKQEVEGEQVDRYEAIKYTSESSNGVRSLQLVNGNDTTTYTIAKNTANDYSFTAKEAKNEVYVQQAAADKKVEIVSTAAGTNSYEVVGGTANTFEYNGANDSYTAYGNVNNSYDIKVSNFDNALVIDDKGGTQDSMTFENITANSLRLFFKIDLTWDNENSKFTGAIADDTDAVFYTGTLSKGTIADGSFKGVVVKDGLDAGKIETIKAKGTEDLVSIDVTGTNGYANQIIEKVVAWANNNKDSIAHADTTTADLFDSLSNKDAAALTTAYNVGYTPAS